MALTDVPLLFGYVTGRYALAYGDTVGDPDRNPDVVAATGAVSLQPVTPVRVVATPPPVTAVTQPVTLSLDAEGYVLDPAGARGVWLVIGSYQVTFQIDNAPLTPFIIEVTTAYTLANPLDLTLAMPLVTPPAPVPGWQAVTQAQYDAMAHSPSTVYLITE